MKLIQIHTPYIKLDAALKYSGVCTLGSDAKARIAAGEIKVNGETCTMRGKKLKPGDTIEVDGVLYEVAADTL